MSDVVNASAFTRERPSAADRQLQRLYGYSVPDSSSTAHLDGVMACAPTAPAAWNAIFLGIDIDAKAFADGVRLTRKTHEDLPDALVAVFAEVLEGCGVHVEDRRLSTP